MEPKVTIEGYGEMRGSQDADAGMISSRREASQASEWMDGPSHVHTLDTSHPSCHGCRIERCIIVPETRNMLQMNMDGYVVNWREEFLLNGYSISAHV